MIAALDLGGSNIRAACVEDGVCHGLLKVKCLADADSLTVLRQIASLIESMTADYAGEIAGIGIAVPSVVDTTKGIVYNAANIPSWTEVHLKEYIEDRFGVETRVNNDCNCFALGESRYGAARGSVNAVGITLGTGIGCGLILNGKLYEGSLCGAGEMGSLPFRDSDYEHYCSSLWFRDYHHTTGAEQAVLATRGDSHALELWTQFGRNLGEFTKAILFAYAPDTIVIGGGIAASMPLFRRGLEESLATFPYPLISGRLRITEAECPDANLIGASLLF